MHESFLKQFSLLQLERPQEIILGIGQGRPRDREQLVKRLDTLRGQMSGPQPLVQSSCTTLPSSLPTHHTPHLCTLTNHYSDPTQFGTGSWCSHSPAIFQGLSPPRGPAAGAGRTHRHLCRMADSSGSWVTLGSRPHRCKTFLLRNRQQGFIFLLRSGGRDYMNIMPHVEVKH